MDNITSIVEMWLDFYIYGHDRTPVTFSHHCCYCIVYCNRIVKRCLRTSYIYIIYNYTIYVYIYIISTREDGDDGFLFFHIFMFNITFSFF